MSVRIGSIASVGLIDSPPVSKVMPLPTSTTGRADLVVAADRTDAPGR